MTMAKAKQSPRPLSDHTQPVLQTIMGKAAPAKPSAKQPVQTVLGAHRGK